MARMDYLIPAQRFVAELRAAKKVAASAQTEWDNYYTHAPDKRTWYDRSTGSRKSGGKGKSWTSDGKGGKKKCRRGGKRQ